MGGFIATLKIITTFFGNNLTKILTGAAVGGVIATAVMSAKDHETAEAALETRTEERRTSGVNEPLTKWEKFSTCAPQYWRTGLFAAGTITCIVAAEMLNASAIAGLTAAGALAKKEIEDKEQKIKDMLSNKQGIIADPNGLDSSLLPGEGKELFIDSWTGQPFWCSRARLMAAESQANQWLLECNAVTLSEVFESLGLPEAKATELVEWRQRDGNGVKFEIVYSSIKLHGEDTPVGVIKYKYARLSEEALLDTNGVFIEGIRKKK